MPSLAPVNDDWAIFGHSADEIYTDFEVNIFILIQTFNRNIPYHRIMERRK